MAYRVVVDPEAYLEIVDGIEWYNKAQAGLGYKFYKKFRPFSRLFAKILLHMEFDTKVPALQR